MRNFSHNPHFGKTIPIEIYAHRGKYLPLKSQGPQIPEKIPTKSKKKANKSKLKSLPAPWAQNPAPWDKNQTCRTYSWGAPI